MAVKTISPAVLICFSTEHSTTGQVSENAKSSRRFFFFGLAKGKKIFTLMVLDVGMAAVSLFDSTTPCIWVLFVLMFLSRKIPLADANVDEMQTSFVVALRNVIGRFSSAFPLYLEHK